MPRLNIERQKQLEPQRMERARNSIENLGYEVFYSDQTVLTFIFNGETVQYFPYSGWHTGKTITDGRGLNKLLKQLKP